MLSKPSIKVGRISLGLSSCEWSLKGQRKAARTKTTMLPIRDAIRLSETLITADAAAELPSLATVIVTITRMAQSTPNASPVISKSEFRRYLDPKCAAIVLGYRPSEFDSSCSQILMAESCHVQSHPTESLAEMDIKIHWQPVRSLLDGSKLNLIYTCDLSAIPERPGVYLSLACMGKW